jgi:hypothetical protein
MGKQVRFYALPKDEQQFLDFIESVQGTYKLASESSSHNISSFILPWSDKTRTMAFIKYFIGFGNPNNLFTYIKKGRHKVYNEEKMDYVDTGEQFYWIDINAPLVEFTPSFIRNDEKLFQGRIWADLYRLEGNEFAYKGDEFCSLYESLAKWIRKNFKRVKGIDGYFGQEALDWYKNGGQIF